MKVKSFLPARGHWELVLQGHADPSEKQSCFPPHTSLLTFCSPIFHASQSFQRDVRQCRRLGSVHGGFSISSSSFRVMSCHGLLSPAPACFVFYFCPGTFHPFLNTSFTETPETHLMGLELPPVWLMDSPVCDSPCSQLEPAVSCTEYPWPLSTGGSLHPHLKSVYIYILANYVQYTYIYNFISYMTSLCYSAARDRSCVGWICGFFHKLLILWKWWCNPGEIVRVSVVLPAVLYIALTRGHEIELASVLLLGFPRSCADDPGSWSWVFPPHSLFSETSSYSGTLQCS